MKHVWWLVIFVTLNQSADFYFAYMNDQISCWCLQGGESLTLQRQQLEELYSAHSGSMSILMEADDDDMRNHNHDFPEGPANFTLLWYARCFLAHQRWGLLDLSVGTDSAFTLAHRVHPAG